MVRLKIMQPYLQLKFNGAGCTHTAALLMPEPDNLHAQDVVILQSGWMDGFKR